jgi:hypothetical protein
LRPKGRQRQAWEETIQKTLNERWTGWNRIGAVAQDCEGWKALCKPFTLTGKRVSSKWREVKRLCRSCCVDFLFHLKV